MQTVLMYIAVMHLPAVNSFKVAQLGQSVLLDNIVCWIDVSVA